MVRPVNSGQLMTLIEILGACFHWEVKNFLAYLVEHHEFSKTKRSCRHEQQMTIITNTSHKKVVISTPTEGAATCASGEIN